MHNRTSATANLQTQALGGTGAALWLYQHVFADGWTQDLGPFGCAPEYVMQAACHFHYDKRASLREQDLDKTTYPHGNRYIPNFAAQPC